MTTIQRQKFLKASGVTLALPWLESFSASPKVQVKKRLLLIGVPLGLHRDSLVPVEEGRDYKPTKYLSTINKFRDQYTIISGLHHPGVVGGHSAEARLFTGCPSNQKNVRSLDQYVASKVGKFTRYDSLVLSSGNNKFSWTDGGSMVPPETKMANVFSKLFVEEKVESKKKVLAEINKGKSIMDFVISEAKSLESNISRSDRQKLEEYYESVRETERRLQKSESWIHEAKPQVKVNKAFESDSKGSDIQGNIREVCDMIHLAFKTDSTRVMSCGYFRQGDVVLPGVMSGYHSLSHHGSDPNNLRQLKEVENTLFVELNKLLMNLKNTREGDRTLLDNTTIVISSNLGSGNNHSTKNLPMMVIGGDFKHGQHLAYSAGQYPLSNLFLSILHQFGINDETFAVSSGRLKGFELS